MTAVYDALFLLALGSPVIVVIGVLVRSVEEGRGHPDRPWGRLLLIVGLLGATYGVAAVTFWSS